MYSLGHVSTPTRGHATCRICAVVFRKNARNQIICSPVCAAEAQRRRSRARSNVQNRPCAHCGTEFRPRNGNQRYCLAEVCQAATRKHRPLNHTPRSCSVCGNWYTPRQRNQLTCSPACSKHRHAFLSAEWNREFQAGNVDPRSNRTPPRAIPLLTNGERPQPCTPFEPEAAPVMRRLYCRRMDACVDHADAQETHDAKKWAAWTCRACPVRDEKPEDERRAEAVALLQLNRVARVRDAVEAWAPGVI